MLPTPQHVAECLLAQALLPPPFPTATPLRCYVSNMAVLPGYRRRGAATVLLQSCARLGAPANVFSPACCLHTIPTWLLYLYLLPTACCSVRHINIEQMQDSSDSSGACAA